MPITRLIHYYAAIRYDTERCDSTNSGLMALFIQDRKKRRKERTNNTDLVVAPFFLELPDIICVLLPVFEVDVWQAAHEQLELLEVEDRQQRLGDDFVEAHQESRELVSHTHKQSVLQNQLHVFADILIRHIYFRSTLLQVHHLPRSRYRTFSI